jgi:hypothetical protein
VKLPDNLAEVYHRARDVMFSNKSQYQIKVSNVITRYLKYVEEQEENGEGECKSRDVSC